MSTDQEYLDLIARGAELAYGLPVAPMRQFLATQFRRDAVGYVEHSQISDNKLVFELEIETGKLNADEAKQIEILFSGQLKEAVGILQHWLPIYRHNRAPQALPA